MEKIIVTCGLPASGKTTFANDFLKKQPKAKYYDVDSYLTKKKCTLGILLEDIRSKFATKDVVIILDGLFTTQHIYMQIATAFDSCKIEFHYWELDRDACTWNDQHRRKLSSQYTIEHLELEIPNLKEFKKVDKDVKIVRHSVIRKTGYQLFKDKYDLDDKIESSSWSLGGSGRTYTGDSYGVSAEPQPEFYEFDTIIENIYPDITFIRYKKIYSECVEVDSRPIRDYYTQGSEGFYVCDVRKLYDALVKYGVADTTGGN